jgi:hypothetical protein
MATGHSLEHPAAHAKEAQGDFIESAQPVPASVYRRYMEHEQPAVGPSRVVRAVLMSDTSPPLYYLLLNAWTRYTGTSDRAYECSPFFGVSLASPFLHLLPGDSVADNRTASLRPFRLGTTVDHYSVEDECTLCSGFWFWQQRADAELHRQGMRLSVYLLWVCASVAGLLTHYFFAFIWLAMCLWLFIHPSRFRRQYLASAVGITAIGVLPWYVMLPQSMSAWRVTRGWLEDTPVGFNAFAAQIKLSWSYFAMAELWPAHARFDRLLMLVLGFSMAAALWRARQKAIGPRWQILWLWLGASNLGLFFFDLWQGTYTREYSRYALAGLPAAFLLVCCGAGPPSHFSQGAGSRYGHYVVGPQSAPHQKERIMAAIPRDCKRTEHAEQWVGRDSCAFHSARRLGIARYFDGPAAMAPWVGQLGSRQVPQDVRALIAGRRRVFLVKIHDVGQPAPEESYLRSHAVVIRDTRRAALQTTEFVPRGAKVFSQPDTLPMP